MADVLVSFVRTTSDKLQSCPKIDGQIVVLTDRPGVFYDALDAEGNLVRNASSEFTYRCTGTNADGSNIEKMISQLKSTGLSSIKLNIVGEFGLDTDREYQIDLTFGGGFELELDFANFKVISIEDYTPNLIRLAHGGNCIISRLANQSIDISSGNNTVTGCFYLTRLYGSCDSLVIDKCKFIGACEVELLISNYLSITNCNLSHLDNPIKLSGSCFNRIICNNFIQSSTILSGDSPLDLSYNNVVTE